MKDGLSEVAWSKLIERHSAENDARVIEAYKISKVYTTDYRVYILKTGLKKILKFVEEIKFLDVYILSRTHTVIVSHYLKTEYTL